MILLLVRRKSFKHFKVLPHDITIQNLVQVMTGTIQTNHYFITASHHPKRSDKILTLKTPESSQLKIDIQSAFHFQAYWKIDLPPIDTFPRFWRPTTLVWLITPAWHLPGSASNYSAINLWYILRIWRWVNRILSTMLYFSSSAYDTT